MMKKKITVLLAILAILALAVTVCSCKSEDNENSQQESAAVSEAVPSKEESSEEPSEREYNITLSETEKTITCGLTFKLEYTIEDSDETPIFTSSRTNIAQVDQTGLVTALRGGESDITVSLGSTVKVCRVTVKAAATSIEFENKEISISINESATVSATVIPATVFDTSVTYSLKEGSESIVSLTAEGVVTGVSVGKAVVIASTVTGITDECTINVYSLPESISLDKSDIELKKGTVATLTADILPKDTLKTAITFSVSDSGVVKVDADGVVTAVGNGTAVVTATTENGLTAECTVKVSSDALVVEVIKIDLEQSGCTLMMEGEQKIEWIVLPANALDRRVTFVSNNPSVASVDASGNVKAISDGTAIITVAATNGVKAEYTVTVDTPQQAAVPRVIGCVYTDNSNLVIVGECDENATVTAQTNSQTVSTNADGKYFSIRLRKESNSMSVSLIASRQAARDSEKLDYTAKFSTPMPEDTSWAVIPGKNYQFHYELTMNDYYKNNTLSQSELNQLKSKISNRISSLKRSSPDTEIIYLLIPSPATVYPESMPDGYKPGAGQSKLEQIAKTLSDAGATVFNLTETLVAHKNDDLKIFWKTDSHWTDYGAYLAYYELFDYISQKFPDAAPREMNEFDFVEDYYYGGDVAHYLGIAKSSMCEYNALRVPKFTMPDSISSIQRYKSDKDLTYHKDTTPAARVIETNRPELPSCYVLRDSYSTALYDILAERMDTTVYKAMWNISYDKKDVASYKPDYLIYIVVERNLDSVLQG